MISQVEEEMETWLPAQLAHLRHLQFQNQNLPQGLEVSALSKAAGEGIGVIRVSTVEQSSTASARRSRTHCQQGPRSKTSSHIMVRAGRLSELLSGWRWLWFKFRFLH